MRGFYPAAFLFDLNGTMIDDMNFHLDVWFSILNEELNAGLSREEVRSHMYGKNNELLERVFGTDRFSLEESDRISRMKEDRYQEIYRPHLKLLPGLHELLNKARTLGIKIAIGSAAIPYNINFVLDALNIRHYFAAIVSADDVRNSKPDPETYLKAAALLNVRPSDCIVFEDAPKGVESAGRAGIKSVVITTLHSSNEFAELSNVLMYVKDYKDPRFSTLIDSPPLV
jgi:beta-phosphoglucomutase